jgi:5-methylcytosine-specific restriction endonuclease McrA
MTDDLPDWLRDDAEPPGWLSDDADLWNLPDWLDQKPPRWLTGNIRAFRMSMNGGSHTRAEWIALCEKHNYQCLCCKRKRKLTRDHVIPVLLGGSDNIENIQPLCQSCNSSTGARHIDYRLGRRVQSTYAVADYEPSHPSPTPNNQDSGATDWELRWLAAFLIVIVVILLVTL